MSGSPTIETVGFEDAEELLRYLDRDHDRWGNGYESPWVFRGHGDASWDLKPRAWRDDSRRFIETICDRLRTNYDQKSSARPDSHVLTAAEYQVVHEFAMLSEELGLPVPDQEKVPSGLQMLLESRELDSWEPNVAFALAQHHAIPTRLLDFSRDPLVAAYFAASECDRLYRTYLPYVEPDGSPPPIPGMLEVWAVNTKGLPSSCTGRQDLLHVFICPGSSNGFLQIQEGLFLWYPQGTSHFASHGTWPDFKTLLVRPAQSEMPAARRITLPAREASTLLEKLWRHRKRRADVMPSFDSVSRTLLQKWQWEAAPPWSCTFCDKRNPGHRVHCRDCHQACNPSFRNGSLEPLD